ncbi:CotH kinase family protein [Flavobacterium stagni]|uniref:T9SS type A sorting domain-containing protein n=1 Tax=Flavobacterium stagni TaxID=2506421 RepID=A0A4V1N2I8_9FLAO|nr:CotH kinase family protein [Flavobacterium stagni]RXR21972.1 T9SS type A sorting domain-containing protein [Flavobacterium stagni]
MKRFLLLFFCLIIGNSQAQNIFINEVMTSNASTIADDDDSYEDWIEIYYTGSIAFNLEGYGLSDLPSNPYQWVFPEYWIEPGDHLLLWCSGKNRTDINYPLHTNFKLSSSGETITLTRPDGTIQDQYLAIIIPTDFSYGRQSDGAAAKVFFQTATPGDPNNTVQGFSEILNPPTFSVAGGFFTNPFSLTLSHPDPGVTIVYTTDGSDPDITNLGGTTYSYKNTYPFDPGTLPSPTFFSNSFTSSAYSSPLNIVNRTSASNDISMISSTYDSDPSYYLPNFSIFKGTVVRARAFKAGAWASKIVTQTYIVSPQGQNRFSIPVMSLSVSENKFFDYNDGIYVAGVDFDTWRTNNPTLEAPYSFAANYDRTGDQYEQVGHVNYFVNGTEVMNQQLGIRINGGGTRQFPNKSLKLYARSEYGSSAFNYSFFPTESYTSYERLILRNSGSDYVNTYYKDAFTHELVRGTGLDTQAYQPSIVLLNGEYWGLLNIRPRYDWHYFNQRYGIAENEIEIIGDGYYVDTGSDAHFQALFSYFQNNSLTPTSNYDYIKTQMDVDNFRDYFITNIFIQNTDWPGWNTYFWRKSTTFTPNAPYGNDGRWRTAIKDTDAGFSLMLDVNDHNTLEFATALGGPDWPNPEWSTLILRRLLENDSFKLSFINRFADMMNTYFLPSRVVGLSSQFAMGIEPEISEQIARWHAPFDYAWWVHSQDVIGSFANERPAYQREHIRLKFGIASDVNATLDVDDATHGYVKINTIDITAATPGVSTNPYPWQGIYFHNIPVTLKAVPLAGYVFSHWSGDVSGTNPEITYTPTADFTAVAHFVSTTQGQPTTPLYFWMMDSNLPNNTPLTAMNSTYEVATEGIINYTSCLVGYPFTSAHPSWRKASMERRNSPTPLNYIPEANNNVPFATANMLGLQIKQPFQAQGQENKMVFNLSTMGYKDIQFAFAAKNENAVDGLLVEYTLNGSTWTTQGLSNATLPLTLDFQLFTLNFGSIPGVSNNPNFKVRIRFYGPNLTQDLGNRVTFNNFSLLGTPITLDAPEVHSSTFIVYPNPTTSVVNIDYDVAEINYTIFALDGRVLQSGRVNDHQVALTELPAGIYLLQLEAEGRTEVKKIIKK